MRFCTAGDRRRPQKRGPSGAPSMLRSCGALDPERRRANGRREAEEQQEGRSQTVEDAFELDERHDTHLSVGTPGERGVFLI